MSASLLEQLSFSVTPPPAARDHTNTALLQENRSRSEVYQALIATGIFSRTDPDTVAGLSVQLEFETFPPGRILDAQHDFGGRLYVIASGKCRMSCERFDGSRIPVIDLGPSHMFGAKTLFDPDSSGFRITTLTEVVTVPIRRDQLIAWMAEHPEIADQFLRLFARWVKTMNNSLTDFVFADAPARIAVRLLTLKQRFGCQEGEAVRVLHDMTLEDLSLFIGVSPETIVMTLRDFEDRGWIRLQENSILITDAEALSSVTLRRAS